MSLEINRIYKTEHYTPWKTFGKGMENDDNAVELLWLCRDLGSFKSI